MPDIGLLKTLSEKLVKKIEVTSRSQNAASESHRTKPDNRMGSCPRARIKVCR